MYHWVFQLKQRKAYIDMSKVFCRGVGNIYCCNGEIIFSKASLLWTLIQWSFGASLIHAGILPNKFRKCWVRFSGELTDHVLGGQLVAVEARVARQRMSRQSSSIHPTVNSSVLILPSLISVLLTNKLHYIWKWSGIQNLSSYNEQSLLHNECSDSSDIMSPSYPSKGLLYTPGKRLNGDIIINH